MSYSEHIQAASAGQDSPVKVFWDSSDPANVGPAYRYLDGSESGPCEFSHWSNGEPEYRWSVEDYFGDNGRYTGPDSRGVYPVLEW